MKVAFDVLPSGDKVNVTGAAAPSQLHVERVLHVEDDDGAIRVWAVGDGVVRLVGKAACSNAVIFTRVGDAPWERVATALEVGLEGSLAQDGVFDDVVADDFVTFDVDREGVPSNLNHHREKELRTHEEGNVQVVVVDGRVTVYANGQVLGRARKEGGALVRIEQGYLVWSRIMRGIATATPWRPTGVSARRSRPLRARSRWTTRKKKWVGFVAALYGFLVAGLVVAAVRDGVSLPVLAVELAVIAIAPLLLAWGAWVLSSPEALREATTTTSDGKKTNGPIATKGLALTTIGALVYVCPAIVAGAVMFAPHSSTTKPPIATARSGSLVPPAPRAPASPAATPAREPASPVATPAPREPASLAAAVSSLGDEWAVATYALAHHLVLDQVKLATPETSIPLALRDGSRERGKRTCATGSIDDIERKDLGNHDVYAGMLTTAEGDGVRFVAVGSGGLLVRRSAATLCGVVIGTAERKVVMVGMFDLPENTRPTVER